MSTKIRSKISTKNPYYIPKFRYLELSYFCRQYPTWKREYFELTASGGLSAIDYTRPKADSRAVQDPTADAAMRMATLKTWIDMVETTAKETDPIISNYILKAVTENLSFTNLKTVCDIPYERDAYYTRYRKFFWLLNTTRN